MATYDFRGQGGSQRLLKDPRKGHVGRFDHYVRDLEIFLEQIVLPDTRLPFFLLAHSTGGLIALKAAPRLSNRIERMVLTAPFVGLGGQKTSPENIRRIATLASFTGFGGITLNKDEALKPFDGNPLTSDALRYARNQRIVADYPNWHSAHRRRAGSTKARRPSRRSAVPDISPRSRCPRSLSPPAMIQSYPSTIRNRLHSISAPDNSCRTRGTPRDSPGAGSLSQAGTRCPLRLHSGRRAR